MSALKFCLGRIAVLTCVVVLSTAMQSNFSEILYEVNGNGDVTIDLFDEDPQVTSLAPVMGNYNPSPRLDSCNNLGAGLFPVHGDCSKYLECEAVAEATFIRRIVGCTFGLWFNHHIGECELHESDTCTMGRLVPNSLRPESANPKSGRNGGPSTPFICSRPGLFPSPGCLGYYFCRAVGTDYQRFEYRCPSGLFWDEISNVCVEKSKISFCSVPLEDDTCLRTCVAGDRRVCKYSFVVHEFASMSSIYCGNCTTNHNDCNLPGCITAGGVSKPIIAINRRMPGPTIQACKGDTLEIEVFNQLSASAVTIHWHGLHQRATPFMDGVPFITQCPIHPGNSFLYRMEADMAGTHMYHSHVGHLETDGLFGSMIIREPKLNELGINNRYDVDLPEHRVLVWHWFGRPAESESLDTRLQSLRREGYGFLINGKGVIAHHFRSNGVRMPSPVETYQLSSNLRHRFRAIFNSALNCPIQLSIDGHSLDILALDGRPVRPQAEGYVDSIIMSAGERVDFVPIPDRSVSTTNQAFYLRLRGLNDCDDNKNAVHQYALIRYDNAGSSVTDYPPPSYANAFRHGSVFNLARPIRNTNLRLVMSPRDILSTRDANTVVDSRLTGTPRKRFYIDASFNLFSDSQNMRIVVPQLNNITWKSPHFPLLTQPDMINEYSYCSQNRMPVDCDTRQCSCPQILEANTGDLVEMVIADTRGNNDIGHPFHLHGFAFKVVTQYLFNDRSNMDRVRRLVERDSITRNFRGPLKDTVLVPGRGFIVIRFIADNPGYWLFHCHISEHMSQGMALALKVGQQREMVRPPSNFPRCGNFY